MLIKIYKEKCLQTVYFSDLKEIRSLLVNKDCPQKSDDAG